MDNTLKNYFLYIIIIGSLFLISKFFLPTLTMCDFYGVVAFSALCLVCKLKYDKE